MLNEELIYTIIGSIFQGFAVSFVIKSLIKDLNKKKFILLFILLSSYSLISLLFISKEFRFIGTIIIVTLIIYFLLNVKDKKAILYSFITQMIVAISEIIGTLLLVMVKIDTKLIEKNYKLILLVNILISLIIISVILIKPVKKFIFKIINLFDNNKKLIKYFYIFIIVVYILVLKNGFEFLLQSNYYLNILFMFGLFLILTLMINSEKNSENLKEQYQQMLNYVIKYEKVITEQGKINHEFKNQLMVIKGYAQMNNIPKLINYLDSIIKDSKKTCGGYLIKELNKFPDGGIKGLLYYKLSMMNDENIKYDLDIGSDVKAKLKNLDVNTYKNITKILGVFLDNAIESSKKAKTKNIIISVEKNKNYVFFTISNTYKGKIDIDKIGTGYTTKGVNHGYGLRLVRDIINNNKECKVENYLEDKYYVAKLIIDINKKNSN